MFEAVESIEYRDRPGMNPVETVLGCFVDEAGARAAARAARAAFLKDQTRDYAWWTVRQAGARLARWIADSRAEKEFVLDLRSGELVELAE